MKVQTMTPEHFKQALSRWASGVTVVTTLDDDGHPKGMTASSFTSVSLDPPLILICVAKGLYTHQVIDASGMFAVNILSREQRRWGELFAGMHPDVEDRFAETGYTTAQTGSPILPGVLGWVDCRVYQQHDAGDHTIFVGEVLAARGEVTGDPLLYAQRAWGHFSPEEG